jgi:hypothetical protein
MTGRPTPGIEISPPTPLPKWLKNRRALKWIGIKRYFLNKYFIHEVFAEQLKNRKILGFTKLETGWLWLVHFGL